MLADFGIAVSWTPAGGSAATLTALFDNAARIEADYAEAGGYVAEEATLTLREADIPAGAAKDDAVTVDSAAYLVKAILPDGTGLANVTLEKDLG